MCQESNAMVSDDRIQAYARLIIRQGVNLQAGQALVIRAEMAHRALVHRLATEAYRAGARYVETEWIDTRLERIRLLESPPEHLDYVPDYRVAVAEERLRTDWAYVAVTGREDPRAYEGVEAQRLAQVQAALRRKLEHWYTEMMGHALAWCVCACPTPAWAQQVYPDRPVDQALEDLWADLLRFARIQGPDDPGRGWQAHIRRLRSALDRLRGMSIRTLHFLDPTPGPDGRPRTDLTVGLTERPRWLGGGEVTRTGLPFSPNIPTEEVFTTPHRERTEGWVRTSRPFFPFQQEVRDAYFRFQGGRVVAFQAAQGQEVLERFFAIEGTDRLGEVALVDGRSPIFQTGRTYYETLIDENAACHLAFGRAYPGGVEGGDALDPETLEQLGVNTSPMHQDVMFGTPTLRVTATLADGREVVLMEEGRYTQALLPEGD